MLLLGAERYAVAKLRYSIFSSDFGTLVTLPVDTKYRDQSLTVVTNIVRSGCCSDFSAACGTSSLPRAVPEPTALLLLLEHLDRPPPPLCRLTLQTTASLLYYRTTQTYPRTTAHNLSSFSQPWWRLHIVHKEHSHQPQATTLPISNQDFAYQAPDRNTSTAAVPYITTRSSRRHIPLRKRALLHPLSHEADVSGLPLGCTIGHTPSYPS